MTEKRIRSIDNLQTFRKSCDCVSCLLVISYYSQLRKNHARADWKIFRHQKVKAISAETSWNTKKKCDLYNFEYVYFYGFGSLADVKK